MEGFIPFLLQKIKKKKPGNTSFRCCSEGSTATRSYHMLIGPDSSYEGSSHRRTRSDSQPPAADQLAAIELAHSRSLRLNNVSDASKLSYFTYGSRRIHSGTYEVPKESNVDGDVSRRKR